MSWYPFLKGLHVLAAVMLLGNVIVTGVRSALLYRHWREGTLPLRPIARAILRTDLVFTVGGGMLLTTTALALWSTLNLPFFGTSWLFQGAAALLASTLVWAVLLLPLQFRLDREADPEVLRPLFLRWSVIGWADTLLRYLDPGWTPSTSPSSNSASLAPDEDAPRFRLRRAG